MDRQEAIKAIRDQHGDDSLMYLGQAPINVERVSSGIIELDDALGGGWPRGRIMEIMGPESSGKTTIALYMMKAAVEAGLNVGFIDLENALDPVFAENTVGLNIEDVLFSQPGTAEKALDLVVDMVENPVADLIVVDSVAALTPRAEIEGDVGDSHMGLVARLMSQSLRKINNKQITSDSTTTVLFINQLRMKIGEMFGNPETTTGGNALKYYSSVRIDTRSPNGAAKPNSPGQIRVGEEVIGKRIRAKVVKNKVAPPFRQCLFDLMFDKGIDEMVGLINIAEKRGLFTMKGAWYYDHNGERLGQGLTKAANALRENEELVDKVREKLFEDNL